MRASLQNAESSALSAGHDSLRGSAGRREHLGNVKLGYVHVVVVLGVCNCGIEQLENRFRGSLGGVFQNGDCHGNVLASDKIENDFYFTG